MRELIACSKAFVLIPLSLLLFACGGTPAENIQESEIIAAVDLHLASNPPASIAPLGGWSDEDTSFPMDIVTPKQSLARSRQDFPTLFALADAGLLTITEEQVLTQNVFGKDEEMPGLRAELTETGLTWYLPEQRRFAYAKLSVAQIDTIQKVTDTAISVTVELEFETIADWTNNEGIQAAYPGMADFLSNTPIIETFQLKFENKQWQVVQSEDLM